MNAIHGTMRSLILAIQFLTRLPTPQVEDYSKQELSSTSPWFPVVGIIVGVFVTAWITISTFIDPWLGALFGLIAWTWVTGALHLDGLADLTDALGAAHRDPQRFLQVMRDPHIGTFGVVALTITLISKLVLLYVLIAHHQLNWFVLPLICAWSRLGAVTWSAWLPSLHQGSGESFAWKTNNALIVISALILLAVCALMAPSLCVAPLVLALWWAFLRYRVGGMTGDCLGAGIEVSEIGLLLITVSAPVIIRAWTSM